MKIININDFYEFYNYPITCDSDLISCDSDLISCDMETINSGKLFIRVTPRFSPNIVNITFYNELKQITTTEECNVINKDGWMDIPFSFNDFKEGETYEISVRGLDDKHIWRGRAFITINNDIQDYKLVTPDNNGKIIL